MSWLEEKYIGIISPRLRNFKRKSPNLWNFSCPLCNDSVKDQRKARAYIYLKKGKLMFHCHNACGGKSVPNLIKEVDEFIYSDYVKEIIQEKYNNEPKPKDTVLDFKKPSFISDSELSRLKKISQLGQGHFAKKYVSDRQIPNKYHSKIFFTSRFMQWINTFVPGKFSEKALFHDGPALVIPFLNSEGRMFALQARYFEGNVRYITIILDESIPKIYGLDEYKRGNKSYVLEGPIDAMFLPNAVATAGGVELSTLKYLNLENIVIVFDNEPRSKDTVKKIDKCIRHDLKVCIWPEGLQYKDVNDMITKGGFTAPEVRDIIDRNTFKGLNAELQLIKWKKI